MRYSKIGNSKTVIASAREKRVVVLMQLDVCAIRIVELGSSARSLKNMGARVDGAGVGCKKDVAQYIQWGSAGRTLSIIAKKSKNLDFLSLLCSVGVLAFGIFR